MSSDSALDADLDALVVGRREAPGNKCLVPIALQQMPESTRNRVIEILDNHPNVSTADLSRTLRERGYDVPYQSLVRHRRRHSGGAGCVCP